MFIQPIIDLLFPPLCSQCQSFSRTKYLCDDCWDESRLLDPEERCMHCFDLVDESGALCFCCKQSPRLPFPRAAVFNKGSPVIGLLDKDMSKAIAGFIYYQWRQLDWIEPDVIVPLQPSKTAHEFSELMHKPCIDLFRRISWPPERRGFVIKEGYVEEGAHILLLDLGSDSIEREKACFIVTEAFPKRVYLLSLIL